MPGWADLPDETGAAAFSAGRSPVYSALLGELHSSLSVSENESNHRHLLSSELFIFLWSCTFLRFTLHFLCASLHNSNDKLNFFFFDSLQQSIDLQNNWTFQWSQQENSFSSCLFWIIKTPTSAITVNKRGKKNAAHCFLTTHHRGRSLTGMQMENNAIKHRQSLDLHPLANLHACSPKQV